MASKTASGKSRICPVCCTWKNAVYSDPKAPIVIEGSPNCLNHDCQTTGTWKAGARYGRSESKYRENLRDVAWEALRDWPFVARRKAELLGVPVPEDT